MNERSFSRVDDIQFWARQLSEHALFFSLGIEIEPFREQARLLRAQWEKTREKLVGVEKLPGALEEAKELVRDPLFDLRDYKVELLEKLRSGTWAGWIFPLFVAHTLRELDYFHDRVFDPDGVSRRESACANVRFMAEHALFAAHLCDPEERLLINRALRLAGRFEDLEHECGDVGKQFRVLSAEAGEDLDRYLSKEPLTKQGNSLIHPVLAEHVVREGRRFLETIAEWR
jgi:hypothetical protein